MLQEILRSAASCRNLETNVRARDGRTYVRTNYFQKISHNDTYNDMLAFWGGWDHPPQNAECLSQKKKFSSKQAFTSSKNQHTSTDTPFFTTQHTQKKNEVQTNRSQLSVGQTIDKTDDIL